MGSSRGGLECRAGRGKIRGCGCSGYISLATGICRKSGGIVGAASAKVRRINQLRLWRGYCRVELGNKNICCTASEWRARRDWEIRRISGAGQVDIQAGIDCYFHIRFRSASAEVGEIAQRRVND